MAFRWQPNTRTWHWLEELVSWHWVRSWLAQAQWSDHHHQLLTVFTSSPPHCTPIGVTTWSRSQIGSEIFIIYSDLDTSHLPPDCICLILSYQTGSRSVAWWEYIPLEASPHHITSDTSPGPALWWEHYLLFTENRLEYPQPSTKLITIHPGKRIPRSYILVF